MQTNSVWSIAGTKLFRRPNSPAADEGPVRWTLAPRRPAGDIRGEPSTRFRDMPRPWTQADDQLALTLPSAASTSACSRIGGSSALNLRLTAGSLLGGTIGRRSEFRGPPAPPPRRPARTPRRAQSPERPGSFTTMSSGWSPPPTPWPGSPRPMASFPFPCRSPPSRVVPDREHEADGFTDCDGRFRASCASV